MKLSINEKLQILADAAKYDVSCASSGSNRKNTNNGLGNTSQMGICHSYTEDGRCVSLLKLLLTNYCIYDCAYCVSRKSNDVPRAAFTVKEVVDLTINFYKRNYIEGLFLSSGIFKNADYTNERLIRIAKLLRTEHNFNGYIHLKIIPGCSEEVMEEAGLYADRLSVNLEIPSERSLKKIAPEKNHSSVYKPMNYLTNRISLYNDEKRKFKYAPRFAPGGQSTQLVIGASPETDFDVLHLANNLYSDQKLRRVYYSGYIPISDDNRLPALKTPPLIRENRLYQADWLMRYYGFEVNEIVNEQHQQLDLTMDPKMSYALRNMHLFPVNINMADREMLLRIPGVGVKSVNMIIKARRFSRLGYEHLKKIGVAMNRAQYFIEVSGRPLNEVASDPDKIKIALAAREKRNQLTLF
ncbi:putative DNA modification/repair radical SAM protein [Fulvivirga sediminis]|uniref:DNA modification/repair radical SAM protein n=1 Tax=Fulvivirga sediminis TaxID=2803949 RepID=A0A937K073_9BACT|nr:putative DNA modification/repair radical SAM protein [Fulvivirga sediminis]MBL3655212.1 putative DNA modification/repair radical SAM protein [Fulvivirga sediminis]